MIVPSKEMLKRSIDVLKQAAAGPAGPLVGAVVMLFQNNINPTPATVLADLTEATYTGYARSSAITWGTAHTEPPNQWVMTGDNKEFDCTGTAAGAQTIYGYAFLSTDTPPILLACELFDDGVQIGGPGDSVLVVPQYGQQPGT